MDKKVAIIGYGWVGKAMDKLFPDAVIYSHNLVVFQGRLMRNPIVWNKEMGALRQAVNKCDVAFICVPTPNPEEGRLDTSLVEEVIEWCECPLLVVRSTVNPGDCDKWAIKYGKRIIMQPEYLGETPAHPMLDPRGRQFLILGGEPEDTRELIEIYHQVYNANTHIREVTAYEAEVIKLTENRAISFKVAQAQELYDICCKAGLNYNTIREAVYGDDERFNLWFTFVYPKKRGFKSKCIPKDVFAWKAWAESFGYSPKITSALLERNREWLALPENIPVPDQSGNHYGQSVNNHPIAQ